MDVNEGLIGGRNERAYVVATGADARRDNSVVMFQWICFILLYLFLHASLADVYQKPYGIQNTVQLQHTDSRIHKQSLSRINYSLN